jgi:hypothetical protein
MKDLTVYKLPARPEETLSSPGIDDRLWNIILACWHRDPAKRLTMTQLKESIKVLMDMADTSPPTGKYHGTNMCFNDLLTLLYDNGESR